MAKHLNKKDIQAIVSMIRGWQEYKLTWSTIIDAVEPLVGKRPTRQSLSANSVISHAYRVKKSAIQGKITPKPRPASLKVAAMRIASLEAELAEVKEHNRSYKQKFTIWQYNAYKHGMKEHQLNAPMPKIDRERSDGEKR